MPMVQLYVQYVRAAKENFSYLKIAKFVYITSFFCIINSYFYLKEFHLTRFFQFTYTEQVSLRFFLVFFLLSKVTVQTRLRNSFTARSWGFYFVKRIWSILACLPGLKIGSLDFRSNHSLFDKKSDF